MVLLLLWCQRNRRHSECNRFTCRFGNEKISNGRKRFFTRHANETTKLTPTFSRFRPNRCRARHRGAIYGAAFNVFSHHSRRRRYNVEKRNCFIPEQATSTTRSMYIMMTMFFGFCYGFRQFAFSIFDKRERTPRISSPERTLTVCFVYHLYHRFTHPSVRNVYRITRRLIQFNCA